jgi:hypothetical protein
MITKAKIEWAPRTKRDEFKWYLQSGSALPLETTVESSKLFEKISALVGRYEPDEKDSLGRRWFDLYAPVRIVKRIIAMHFGVVEIKDSARGENALYVIFELGISEAKHIKVVEGNGKAGDRDLEEFLIRAIGDADRFTDVLEKGGASILQRMIPYEYRTGKIKGKYLTDRLMKREAAESILSTHKKYQKNAGKVKKMSVNEYLRVAHICYSSAYGKKYSKLTPLEAYKSRADGRHGGMLEIKDADSEEEWEKWRRGERWLGSHPWEIVFSWSNHGVLLHPPHEFDESRRFKILVSNYAYAEDYLKMVKGLIKAKIAFEAPVLEEVLEYLKGETYHSVNKWSKNCIFYVDTREERKKYFDKIEWDEIKLSKIKV